MGTRTRRTRASAPAAIPAKPPTLGPATRIRPHPQAWAAAQQLVDGKDGRVLLAQPDGSVLIANAPHDGSAPRP